MKKAEHKTSNIFLPKSPTGINGFDEITRVAYLLAGLRWFVVVQVAEKRFLELEFLVRGATQFNEPGVFMSFEETNEELTIMSLHLVLI
jgi:circadian clock protein KaiC